MDSTAEIAFMESGMYAPPRPFLDMFSEQRMPGEQTANVRQHAVPVILPAPPAMNVPPRVVPLPVAPAPPAVGDDTGSVGKLVLALGLMGAGVGVVYALAKTPTHTPNRRRRRR
jgi:hypothetical protein